MYIIYASVVEQTLFKCEVVVECRTLSCIHPAEYIVEYKKYHYFWTSKQNLKEAEGVWEYGVEENIWT